ncbi:MAG: hypothetical protein WCL51_15620 [Bacteroidota bacterium]
MEAEEINKIIKVIDDELINNNKEYLLLSQANNLLVDKDIFTIQQKLDKSLKKILEENKIPHAYQTEKAPKQWRIPKSDKGKLRKVKKKTSKVIEKNDVICPYCKNIASVPKELLNEHFFLCPICKKQFKNTLNKHIGSIPYSKSYINNNINAKSDSVFSKKYWDYEFKKNPDHKIYTIIIVIIFVLYILGTIFHNPEREDREYKETQKDLYRYEKEKQATDEHFNNLKEEAKKEVDKEDESK